MAGQQRDGSKERLPEHETLQELATAIVREAGIAQEQTALMEGNKRRAEVAKTLVIMSSGLLVGIAAVVGIMPPRAARLLYCTARSSL